MGINWDWSGIGKGFDVVAGAIGDYKSNKHKELAMRAKQLIDRFSTTDPSSPQYAQVIDELTKINADIGLEGGDTTEISQQVQRMAQEVDRRSIPFNNQQGRGRGSRGRTSGLGGYQGVFPGDTSIGVQGTQINAPTLDNYRQQLQAYGDGLGGTEERILDTANMYSSNPLLQRDFPEMSTRYQQALGTQDYGALDLLNKEAAGLIGKLQTAYISNEGTSVKKKTDEQREYQEGEFDRRTQINFDNQMKSRVGKGGGGDGKKVFIDAWKAKGYYGDAIQTRLTTAETNYTAAQDDFVKAFLPTEEVLDLNNTEAIKTNTLNQKIQGLNNERGKDGRTTLEVILTLDQMSPNGDFVRLGPIKQREVMREWASTTSSEGSMHDTPVDFASQYNFAEKVVLPAVIASQLTAKERSVARKHIDRIRDARANLLSTREDVNDQQVMDVYTVAVNMAATDDPQAIAEIGSLSKIPLTPRSARQVITLGKTLDGLNTDLRGLGKIQEKFKTKEGPHSKSDIAKHEQVNQEIADKFDEAREIKQQIRQKGGVDKAPPNPIEDIPIQVGEPETATVPPGADALSNVELSAWIKGAITDKLYSLDTLNAAAVNPEVTAVELKLLTALEAATGKKVDVKQLTKTIISIYKTQGQTVQESLTGDPMKNPIKQIFNPNRTPASQFLGGE